MERSLREKRVPSPWYLIGRVYVVFWRIQNLGGVRGSEGRRERET